MQKPNAIGWFDLYVDDMGRATTFYETVFQRRLDPIGDPTGETVMHSFPADMAPTALAAHWCARRMAARARAAL